MELGSDDTITVETNGMPWVRFIFWSCCQWTSTFH